MYVIVILQKEDINRTIGINTKYIGTLDFDLEKKDSDFLVAVICKAIKICYLVFTLYMLMTEEIESVRACVCACE